MRGLAGNRPGKQRRREAVSASHVGRASRARRASGGGAQMVRRWSARASRADGRRASEPPRQAAVPAARVASAAASRAQRVSAARRRRRDARSIAVAHPRRRRARRPTTSIGTGSRRARRCACARSGQVEERAAAPPRRSPPRPSDAPWPRRRGCGVGGAKNGGRRFQGQQCSAVILPLVLVFFKFLSSLNRNRAFPITAIQGFVRVLMTSSFRENLRTHRHG